jgi:hypothetical protein
MKTTTEIMQYFHERRLYFLKLDMEIKNVYMSKDVQCAIFSEFSFTSENMTKKHISDYTFRGLPIVLVFEDNYFEVGI